ncbi:MAG: hypothetical protein ACLU9S_08425 [Oscillospiraceae bacterium]
MPVPDGGSGADHLLPGCLYNFRRQSCGARVCAGGVRQIAARLWRAFTEPTACVLLETMAGKGTEIGSRFQGADDPGCGAEPLTPRLPGRPPAMSGTGAMTCPLPGWCAGEFGQGIGPGPSRAIHLNDSKNPPGARKIATPAWGRAAWASKP